MGDPQVLRGLLPAAARSGRAAPAGAAGRRRRPQYLADLARLGQVVFEMTGAMRINYAIFGNVEPALHAHVLPRYADEPGADAHGESLGLRLEQGAAHSMRRATAAPAATNSRRGSRAG